MQLKRKKRGITTIDIELASSFSHSGLDVATLFNNKFLADFTILCDPHKVILAHKVVLAMSSRVFKRMLDTDCKESSECQLIITDFAYEVVLKMIQFIYTGDAPNIETMARDLLRIAEKYELPQLKAKCESKIIPTLSVNTVLDTLDLADTYNAAELEKAAIRFIKSHFKDIRAKSDYSVLPQHLLVKLLDAAMDYST